MHDGAQRGGQRAAEGHSSRSLGKAVLQSSTSRSLIINAVASNFRHVTVVSQASAGYVSPTTLPLRRHIQLPSADAGFGAARGLRRNRE